MTRAWRRSPAECSVPALAPPHPRGDVPDGRHVRPCVCMWGNPAFCSFSRLFSQPNLQQVKTNPEPDKPLALKSRVVVEFTADEGLVTRNKSTSPAFR